MSKHIKLLITLFLFTFISISYAKTNEFPGRQEFPKIKTIELDTLKLKFKDYLIIDTRSHYEYETLRIKGAINIPVAEKTFESDLEKAIKTNIKPIVFYCNGRSCFKSYIAAKKARAINITNTLAFDAGIFEWTMAQPKKAELHGKSPVRLSKLISKKEFQSRLLDPDTFSGRIFDMDKRSVVLDIRDKYQRAGVGFYPGKERWASLDDKRKLSKYLKKAKKENKVLFIYDEVGKQVRWFQYALQEAGFDKYFFMKQGARGYFKVIDKIN